MLYGLFIISFVSQLHFMKGVIDSVNSLKASFNTSVLINSPELSDITIGEERKGEAKPSPLQSSFRFDSKNVSQNDLVLNNHYRNQSDATTSTGGEQTGDSLKY
jgi:hypothetical protein